MTAARVARARAAAVRFRRPAEISDEAALAVLTPVIEHVAELYAEAGLDRLSGLEIVVSAEEGGEGRNFAACREDGLLIVLSPDLIQLQEETTVAIIAHEFGHACDFLYPAQWVRDRKGGMFLADTSKRGVPAGEAPLPAEWVRDWRGRDSDTVERTADGIAESVTGFRIGYGGPCLLQTVKGGVRPRPAGLR